MNAQSTIADVEPEVDSCCIDLPIADSGSAGLHTTSACDVGIRCEKIPRHEAVACHSSEFQVTVGTFPVIAQVSPTGGESTMPAETDTSQSSIRCTHKNGSLKAGFFLPEFDDHLDIFPLPVIARAREIDLGRFAFAKKRNTVRDAQYVGKRHSGSGRGRASTNQCPCCRRYSAKSQEERAPGGFARVIGNEFSNVF